LVLASLPALRDLLDAADDLEGLDALEREVAGISPEDINDSSETAPSKMLIRHVPGYRKTLHGPQAATDTGLPVLRAACPRFDAWVRQLEEIGGGKG